LFKNMEQYNELYRFLYDLLIQGNDFKFMRDNPNIRLCNMFGNGYALDSTKKIMHNRKHDERISNDI
jgi:hypothetical protein